MDYNSENNEENKKIRFSNHAVKIAVLCTFSLCVISAVFASFITKDRGGDNSRVASFSVNAVDSDEWDYQLTELFCRFDIAEDIDDDYYQYLAYKVDITSESEVDVKYTAKGLNFAEDKYLPFFVEAYIFDKADIEGAEYPKGENKGPALEGLNGKDEDDLDDSGNIVVPENPFYDDGSIYLPTYVNELEEEYSSRKSAEFKNNDGKYLSGLLETAGKGADAEKAEFYIIFRVDYKAYNDYIENVYEGEPTVDDFTYPVSGEEGDQDSYMQYLKEFEFDIDIDFVQVD